MAIHQVPDLGGGAVAADVGGARREHGLVVAVSSRRLITLADVKSGRAAWRQMLANPSGWWHCQHMRRLWRPGYSSALAYWGLRG